MQTLSLESFKEMLSNDREARERLTSPSDIIDLDNGSMVIHRENLIKYLEKYSCKDEGDLEDTMWFSYGVYVKII